MLIVEAIMSEQGPAFQRHSEATSKGYKSAADKAETTERRDWLAGIAPACSSE